MPCRIVGTVNDHAEAAVDDLAPAYAASVVDRNPGGAAERIADDILDGHVGRKLRTVIDVGGLTERRICAGNIMVVASEHDRSGNFAVSHSLVEGQCNLRPAFTVRIENSCLGTYHEMVLAGLFYPVYVVTELTLNLFRRLCKFLGQYLDCNFVCLGEVLRFLGHTHLNGPNP